MFSFTLTVAFRKRCKIEARGQPPEKKDGCIYLHFILLSNVERDDIKRANNTKNVGHE